MSGFDQIVSVDSTPRGAPIFNEHGHIIDTTPVLLEQKRSGTAEYFLKDGKMIEIDCHYRWFVSAGGNSLFSLVTLNPIFLAGIGVDLLTGAAWRCPTAVAFPVKLDESFVFCRKYVVVVNSIHRSEKERSIIRKHWFNRKRNGTTSCVTLVTGEKTSETLNVFGLSARKNVDFGNDETFIRDFALRSKATNVVILDEGDVESVPHLKVTEIDAHSMLRRRSALSSPLKSTKIFPMGLDAKAIYFLSLLLPNSASIGAEAFIDNSDYSTNQIFSKDLTNPLTYLGRMSLERISARRALWRWNFGTSLYLHSARIDQDLKSDKSEDGNTDKLDKLKGYYFNYGFRHSLSVKLAGMIGYFSIFTGLGHFETVFKGDRENVTTFNTIYEIKSVNFITDHIFSKGSVKLTTLNDVVGISDSSASNFIAYNIEFGYLF